LNLYAEAITKMPENPGIPPLFRGIFKNAYLPYRDPETLKMFLKVIDEFTYDHSERLGDAFEYLLSVLGSQGDAGQFRTPRHIIDFIVAIVDPKKHETILDPACGTAGFLISSYKHILAANTDKNGNSKLTPDEKGRLAKNFKGYDISPDMVRLSLVNLYLHGFTDPHIDEYDTLTSEDKWNEFADVILANPPFMSPKGGIKPHKRFSVQSKRSEVLFVDYMAEHLTPNGRAGIIVPEGIIFQSQTAYTQLRKMLVEEYLVAVVSLPAGVFNPYSGVKTSILILDKSLAKQAPTIAFFKIENDGFGLGAQRREIEKNDLPQARIEIAEYLRRLRAHESVKDFQPTLGLVVPKEKIEANGDYNLSGERYRISASKRTTFPRVPLASLCTLMTDGDWVESKDQSPSGIRLVQTGNVGIGEYLDKPDHARFISEETFIRLQCTEIFPGDVLISRLPDPVGRACQLPRLEGRAITAVDCSILRFNPEQFISSLFPYYTKTEAYYAQLAGYLTGSSRSRISRGNLETIEIPLPPLAVQQEIVAEIEGYQKVIDGARAVLDNYRPHIPIHPDWPTKELGEVCRLGRGFAFKSEDYVAEGILSFRVSNIGKDRMPDLTNSVYLPEEFLEDYADYQLQEGDFVIVMVGATTGKIGFITADILPALLNQNMWRFFPDENVLNKRFLYYAIDQLPLFRQGGARDYLRQSDFLKNPIPLPSLATQQQIVSEIEAEQRLVAANRELIARFERKIATTLARIWGEAKHCFEEELLGPSSISGESAPGGR
jgi:type I restriction enzyme M protein